MRFRRRPADPNRGWDDTGAAKRRGRGVRKLALWAIVLAVGFGAPPALFIGFRCYSGDSRSPVVSAEVREAAAQNPAYRRDEASTYLTFPEWSIVYSTEEHAAFIERQAPSAFPYFGSVVQYWSSYSSVCRATKGVHPFNAGTHLMLGVIGMSFTAENVVKGIYENSIGRLTEWLGTHDTEEDTFAYRTEREYGAFMHHTPWYRYSFAGALGRLWSEVPFRGPHLVRKLERRAALTLELSAKAVYGWLIGLGSTSVYGPEELATYARVVNGPSGKGPSVMTLPRYEAFTPAALKLIDAGASFQDVAGNDRMLITVLAPRGALAEATGGGLLFRNPVLTDETLERVGIDAPVVSLHEVIGRLRRAAIRVEHLYDY